MTVNIIKGNIFTSKCQTLVNTVNCVGVMGAGIAFEYRLRYPEMYERYAKLCKNKQLDIGLLWIYQAAGRKILNFPTKKHWRLPSKVEYLHAGLEKLCQTYKTKGIESIALPLLGADRGGLSSEQSLEVMEHYLGCLDIPVEIYLYDSEARDDLYNEVKKWIKSNSLRQLTQVTGIRGAQITKLVEAIQDPAVRQVNQLIRCEGVGEKTLEKLYAAFFNQQHLTDSLF